MSTYTKTSHTSGGQHNITGKRYGSNTQEQCGAVCGGRAGKEDWPFPSKPISHRRPLNSKTEDKLHQYELTITEQEDQMRRSSSSQERHSDGGRQTAECQHLRHTPPRKELQVAKEIQTKELILQEKLFKVAEKIRQKIQRDSVDMAEKERVNRGVGEAKTRWYEQHRREPERDRGMVTKGRQEDVNAVREKKEQRHEERKKTTQLQNPQLQRKEFNATHEITFSGQEVSGGVKRHARRRGDNIDDVIRGETGVKFQDGAVKTKDRGQTAKFKSEKGWTREEKTLERTYKELYGLDEERSIPQMSQPKISQRVAAESYRGVERKLSGEVILPPVLGLYSGRPEQEKLSVTEATDNDHQLLPCRTCNRKFASQRLEVHMKICKKVKQSHRQVFNSYVNRTKGSAIEEFWKTHSRAKTPEVGHDYFCLFCCGCQVWRAVWHMQKWIFSMSTWCYLNLFFQDLKKKNPRQTHRSNTRNLSEGRLPAGSVPLNS